MNALKHLLGLFSSEAHGYASVVKLFKLEVKLAKLSIGPLLISMGLLLVLAFSCWLTLIMLVAYLLYWLFDSLLAGILGVLILHLLLILCLIPPLMSNMKNIGFVNTRKILNRNTEHEPIEKKST